MYLVEWLDAPDSSAAALTCCPGRDQDYDEFPMK